MTIDFVKDGVGLELGLGKEAFIESRIFVGFPRCVEEDIFQIAIALVPTTSLAKQMPVGAGNFESVSDMLQEARPLSLRYPFAIIGFSEDETPTNIVELTSELDVFLIKAIGMTLDEMVAVTEQPNYDFKLQLSKNDKLAQEVCGFANLKGGGYILLGIDKNGRPVGLLKGKPLDDIQLQITNVIHDNCRPRPRFDFYVFDNPEGTTTSILITRVYEIERKPCMFQDRVYIRSGSSVRPADSEEIRRLVLG
jgi:hypothetical protein